MQFNDSGVLGGDPGLTFNKTTDCLALGAGAARPWAAGQIALDIGPIGHLRSDASTCEIGANLFYDGAWKYCSSNFGSLLYSNVATAGGAYWAMAFAPTGVADAAATITKAFHVNANGVYTVDGSAAAPAYSFINYSTTGFYAFSANAVRWAFNGTAYTQLGVAGQFFNPSQILGWYTDGTFGALDAGLARNAAGVVEINSGTAGTFRDLRLRNLTASGIIDAGPSTGTIAAGPAGTYHEQDSGPTGSDAAYIGFNRTNQYAALLGIDTDNQWKVGGWSMGAVSYKLLHEGNSFTIAGNGDLNSGSRNVLMRDITANRANGTGALFFADGSKYLYYDTSRYYFLSAAPVTVGGSLAVGGGQVTPLAPLDVKTAANQHFVTILSGGPSIGYINDAFSAWQNIWVQGSDAFWPAGDNLLSCGGSGHSWKSLWSVNGTIQPSDARKKKNITDSDLGLAFIENLHPVSYQWINGGNVGTREPDYEEDVPEFHTIDGTVIPATTRTVYKDVITPTEGKRTHYGLIAQEVAQAVQASGTVDFGGYVQTDLKDPESELGLNYSEFIAPLIKAVQELSARVKALEAGLP